jgi:hypothetical protein
MSYGIKRDPVEETPEYLAIADEVDKLIKEHFSDELGSPRLGMCHCVWAYKKRILKTKYGIDWRSPAEMNPLTLFD